MLFSAVAAGLCRRSGPAALRVTRSQYPNPVARCFGHQSGGEGNRTSSIAGRLSHAARRSRAAAESPAGTMPAAFGIGQGAVAGAAALGLGALAFYGLGLSNEVGAVEKAVAWPQYVKDRIRTTYGYFGASVGLTAAVAASIFRSPRLLGLVARQGWVALGVSIAAMIGTGMAARAVPYEDTAVKHLAWALHCGVLGAVVAPVCFLGGPVLLRAAWYTAGMVGGLTTVAACAPGDKFLYLGGPLAMGFGAVFAASVASAFLPATTAVGAGVYSFALYGGLILFGGFLLYDTQKIIRNAERHPLTTVAGRQYDPINASMGIYADTINIFIRIAQILAMNQGGRRK